MTLRHPFGYPDEPTAQASYNIKHYDTEQFGINWVIERDLLDEFSRTYHRKYIVNQLCKEFSSIENHDVRETNKWVNVLKEVPENLFDHFVVKFIPRELWFGWLTPKFREVTTQVINVQNIGTQIVKHYHRALVDPNLGRSIAHAEPVYEYGTPYHRMAVYGYNPKELSTNIKTVVSLMRNKNGEPPRKLILTPDDYCRLLCTPGEFCYSDLSDKQMEYFGVPVIVDNSTDVSYLVA